MHQNGKKKKVHQILSHQQFHAVRIIFFPFPLRTLRTHGSFSPPAWSSLPSSPRSWGRWCWTRCCCWRSALTRRWRPRAARSDRRPTWSAGSEDTWRWGFTVSGWKLWGLHQPVSCALNHGMSSFLSPDLPLRQVVGEECVAFMLNWRENDYLTLQVPPSLVMNNPYIKVKHLFSSQLQ